MKKFLMTALYLACLLTITQVEAGVATQNLVKGQSTTITVDYPLGDVAITDDEICDYVIRDNRREIYLNPRKAGSTKMTLWDADGKKRDEFAIHVQDITRDAIYQEAVQKFGAMKEVKIELSSGWIVLSGKVGSRLEYRQIQEFAQKYPQVENDVRLAPAVVDTMIQQIEKEIAIPGVRVRQVRNQLLLEGLVYSKESYKKAETIARLYAPDVVNLIEVRESTRRPGKDRLVQIDVHLMEIKKSAIKSLGVSWAPGSTTTATFGTDKPGGFFQSLVGTFTNLFPKITFLRQSGGGRVLENPKLIVKSGETGDFFSGTTVHYKSERNVEFKDAGVRVKASPIATANDVDLQIEVELSSLAPGGSGNIDKNSLNTTVFCPAGKSAILGGIIGNRDNKVFNKAPDGAGALFALAASKDFQTNQSEFFIILTPTILHEPTSAESELSEWLDTQGKVIRDRSKKEFRENIVKQTKGAR